MTFTGKNDGCEQVVEQAFNIYETLSFTGVTDAEKICQASGVINLVGSPIPAGGTGVFKPLAGLVNVANGQATFDPSLAAPGVYNIEYDFTGGDGCPHSVAKTIEVVSAPTNLFNVVGGGFYCNESPLATKGVTIGLSGSTTGVTYELLRNGVSLSPAMTFTGNGSAFNFQQSGVEKLFTSVGRYSVAATQNSCNAIMNGTVDVVMYEPVLQLVNQVNVSCNGETNGSVTVNGTGGSGSYEYSIDAGASWQSSPIFSGLDNGTYQFSIRDVSLSTDKCDERLNILTVTITEPSKISIIDELALKVNVGCTPCTAGVDCEGSATISVSGGTPDYTTYPGVGYDIIWSTGGTTLTETGMPVGTHSVTVTDGNGCRQTIAVEITANSNLALIEDPDPVKHIDNVCHLGTDGSYVVLASGGSGSYEFSLTDPATTAEVWLPASEGSNGFKVTGLASGVYNIWVRDANTIYHRCITQLSSPVTIEEPTPVSAVEENQTSITCHGATDATFVIRASGGLSGDYEFSLSNPAMGASWESANNGTDGYLATGLGAGVHPIWVRDAVNTTCNIVRVDVTILDITALSYVVDEHINVLCNSGSNGRIEVTAQGGSGNYVYQWEFPLGTIISTEKFVENRIAGDYHLTIQDVSDPTNVCTPITHTFSISEPSVLSFNLVNNEISECASENNGSLEISVSGGATDYVSYPGLGYNITWSNGEINKEKIENLSPGNYTVQVTDANGCSVDNTLTPYVVDQFGNIILDSHLLEHNKCFGTNEGKISLDVSGGSGIYQFRLQGDKIIDWTNTIPANTDQFVFSNLEAGNYEVLVRDALHQSCQYSLGNFTITQPNEIVLSYDPTIDIKGVSCYGGNDGSITVSTAGGSGLFDYSLDNGASWIASGQPGLYTFSNLSTGNYTIMVKDALGCEGSNKLNINIEQLPDLTFSLNPIVTHVSCHSGNDGEVILTGQGGSNNYDYSIDGGLTWQPTGVFSNLVVGTYQFSLRDKVNTACEKINIISIDIVEPNDFSVTENLALHADVNCFGDATGSFTVSAVGGEGNFEYRLFDGVVYSVWQTSPTFNNLSAQTYQVSVRDLGTAAPAYCEKTNIISVIITEPVDLPVVDNVSITNNDCYGGDMGEIDVTVSGGTTPYSLQWRRVSDNAVLTPLVQHHPDKLYADDYKLVMTDNKGCTIEKSYPVTQPTAPITVLHSVTHITVVGIEDGSIAVDTPTGGTAPYTISWSDGVSFDGLWSRSNLASGNYSYTVTDSKNCSVTNNVSIIGSTALNFSLDAAPLNCFGNQTGTIEVAVTGGTAPFNIEWSGTRYDGTTDSGNVSDIPTNYTISSLFAGTYTVKLTDANGELAKVKTITQPNEITISPNVIKDISCNGSGDGQIHLNVSSLTDPSAYAMNWNGPGGFSVNGTVAAVSNQSNLFLAGDYYVTVSYNGTCNVSKVYTITEPIALSVTNDLANSQEVSCAGGADGQIAIVVNGGVGFGYKWYKWNPTLAGVDKYELIVGESNPIIKNRDAGRYKVVAQLFSTGCEVEHEVILNDPDPLSLNVTQTNISTCYGDNTGALALNINGGTTPYRYDYGNGEVLLPSTETFKEVTGLNAGTYNVVVIDNMGCSVTSNAIISQPKELAVTIIDYGIACEVPASGSDGFIQLSIDGGYELNSTQNYLITLKPTNGLLITRSVVNNSGLAVSEVINGLLPEHYELKVYDQNSSDIDKCVYTNSFDLETIQITGTPVDASCESVNDGEIQNINISGVSSNYTYTWSSLDGGVGFDNSTLNQAGLSRSIYRLTVTDIDRGSCVVTKDFVVNTAKKIVIDAVTTDVSCFGKADGTIQITPNHAGYDYTWSGPGITATNEKHEDLTDLIAGRYQLVVADGVCVYVDEYDVKEKPEIDFVVSYEITSCDPYQRTIVISALSGGTGNPATDYTFSVSGPGAAVQDLADKKKFVVTQGGEYTIEVFDKNMCSTVKHIVIPKELVKNEDITDVICNSGNTGSIILNLSGGSGAFNYVWTKTGDVTFNKTTAAIDQLTAGEYKVIVTDIVESDLAGSCSREWTFTVNEPQALVIGVNKGDITCNGDNNGFINLDVNGGVAPYVYNWSPVSGGIIQGSKNQKDLFAGSYSVSVNDNNNCTSSQTIVISEDAPIAGVLNVLDTECDGTNGSIELIPSGGSGNYIYNWSTSDGNHSVLDNTLATQTALTGGTYTVVVTDKDPAKSSCLTTLSTALTKAIQVSNIKTTDVHCVGNNSGRIEFDVTGGDGNYSYTWTTLEGDASLIQNGVRNQSGLSKGRYQVVINDGRTSSGTDCSITEVFEIKSVSPIMLNASITGVQCFGESTGQIYLSISGGSGDFSYNWNSGLYASKDLINVPAGNYTLVLTDNIYGCTLTAAYVISESSAALKIDVIDPTNIQCAGEATGEIQVVVSGGTPPYTYLWTGTNNPTGDHPTGLAAGTYSLSVTDANGCMVPSGNIVLTEPAQELAIDPAYIVQHVSTPNGVDGSIQVTVNGGVGTYQYQWEDNAGNPVGTNSNMLENVGSGEYNVTVTDDNGCTAQIQNIFVEEPNLALDFNYTEYHVRPCNGNANGIIDVTRVFGGTSDMSTGSPAYQIQITQGALTLVNVNALSYRYENVLPGTYLITVTDALGVQVSKSVSITEEPVLSILTSVLNDASCYKGNDGAIEVTVAGGRPNVNGDYLVEINGDNGYYDNRANAKANTAFTFSGLPQGNYTIRVTDYAIDYTNVNHPSKGNCYMEDAKLISEPEANVQLSVMPGDDVICMGEEATLSMAVSNWDISSESLTVTLYDGDAYVEHAVNTSPYTFTVKPDRNRFYSIVKIATVGNTTCLKGFDITPVPVEVKVLQPPTATLSSNVNEVCLGNEVSLSVAFTGVGPWTFTWVDSNNGTSETITTADNPYIINNAPIANAQYVVNSVSNGTCNNTGVGTVDVIVNSIPTVSLSGSTAICANDLTGATLHFDFTGQAPYTVVLHANGVEQTLVFNSDSEDWVVKPSETTTYSVKSIADKNNCQQVVSGVDAIVTVNQMPEDINAILVDNSMFVNGVCQGAVGVSYSVLPVNFADGGYTWIAPANSTIVSGNGTTSVVLDFDNNFMGGYLQVRAVNACGSGRIAELWIPAKELPGSTGIITGPTELCQGSSGFSYSIAPVANATEYRWELPTGFTITSTNSGAAITVELDPMLDAITSTIKVTPVNACGEGLDVATLNVEVYPLPEAYAGHNAHVCGSSQVYSMQASDPSLINPAYVGQWTVVSGSASIANSSQYNTTVTNLSRGDVVFRWTVSNNASVSHQCDVYSEVTIRNNALSVLATVDNSNVCNSTVELTGTAIPKDESGIPLVGTNGLWEVIEPVGSGANIVQSTDHVTQVTNLEIGRNVFRWTINQNGCPSSAEIEVYNREPSDAIISTGSYVDVCDDKVTLTAVDPVIGNGTWSLVSGSGLIATPNNFTTLVSGLKKGANVFRYTVENSGCIKSNTVTVFNNLLEVSAGLNQKICADSYILDATASDPSNGIVGQWSTTESLFFVDGQSAATEVRDLKQGDNVLTWTLTQNGCSSSANVTITNNLPSPASVGSNRDVCAYESTLQGSLPNVANGEYGYWSIIKGSGKFEDFEQADTKVSGLSHGENVFRWTVTHEECSSYADQTIRNLHVDTYAGKDTAICGKTVTLTANQPLTDDVGEWSLVAGVGGATYKPGDRNNPTILMGGLDYGTNGFIWTIISEGCASSDSIYVTNNNPYYIESGTGNKLEISAGPPISINAGSSATMSADTPVGGGTGMWSLISGGGDIVDANSAGTLISNLQRGESVFRWTVKKEGCSYWSDVTITNGEIEKAYAGRNDTVCTPEANLLANEPINALGEWSIIEGAGAFADKNKFNTKVTGLALGVNMFRWTLYNGATSDADDVIVYNSMVTAKTGKDAAICNSDEYILSGTIPTPGREKVSWSVVSGSGVFDFQTQHTTRISGLAQGENIIKYEIAYNRCRAEDYISVVNNTPTIPLAGDDVTICQDSIQLAPNTPTYGAGEWIKVSGNVDASALDNNWAKKLAPGENILHWRITNKGCALEDEIIIVNNQPTKAYAGKDNPVCDDHTVLAGNVPRSGMGSGHWELIAGSGIIADINDAGSEVTNLGPGVNRFRWTIDNNGCKSISEVNISYDHIQAFAGYEQVICGDETILEANVAYPGDGAWGIVAGGGSAVFEDQNSPTSKVTGLDPGTNTLTWTITHGKCQSVSQVIIVNDSPSKVYAGDDRSLCDENSATLKATRILDGRGTGSWTIRNGSGVFSQLDVNNPTVSDIAFGDNIYRWTVKHNECTEVDDVVISYNRIEATVGQNQAICSDEVLLEANSAGLGVGTWTIVGGTSQAVFENQNDPNTKVSKLAKGANVLKWNIDYKGCVTNAEVTITNNSPTSAYAGVLQELCKDNTLLDATPPTIGVGSWEVLMGSGTIANNSEAKSAVSGLSKGDNVFRWTVANGICTSEDVVRIVNNEPSIPYAGKDDESCSTTVELKAETPTYGSGLWSIVNGGGNFDDPTRPNAVISNLNPGENILKWTITRGQCDLDHSITIVNNAASVANAGPDIQDCKDWSMLDANTPASGLGNGQWALVSGKGEFDNVNNAKTAIRNLGFGENILKWTITHGSCFTSDLVTIFNKIPDQAAAGDDRVTCEDYAVLNANNPVDGTGTWSVESGSGAFENPHQYNTKVTDVGYGSNVYKWTIAYGDCVTEDVLVVTSNKAKPYAGEDDVTYDNFYTLKAQNPGELKGIWTVVAGGGTFDDTGFFNTTVRNLSVGKNTLRWTINTAGCVAYNDVIIEYKEVPDAGFTVDHEAGCFPFDVSFTNYTVGGNNYVWDFGDGGSSSERNPVYTYHTPGEYTAILTVAGPDGNNAIFTQVITVHDHPVANFEVEPNEVYLPQDAIQCVDLSVNATRWLWQFGDGVTSEEQNPSYIYNSEGVYTVTLTVQNSFGCENTFVVDDAVVAHLSGFLKFPTAFKPRPGGAGNSGSLGERTDVVFKPKSRDVEEFHMQIFNRWGQLIFETHDVNEGWDGNHKGQLAPQAVYVYKASGMYNNGRVFNKAGSVLLVR